MRRRRPATRDDPRESRRRQFPAEPGSLTSLRRWEPLEEPDRESRRFRGRCPISRRDGVAAERRDRPLRFSTIDTRHVAFARPADHAGSISCAFFLRRPTVTVESKIRAKVLLVKREPEVLELVRAVYSDIGGSPNDLITVRPLHGGWLNALMFEVVRNDNTTIRVARADIDRTNRRSLTRALRTFKQASTPPTRKLPLAQQKGQRKAAPLAEKRDASVKEDASRRSETRLLLLCGSCSIERQHSVAVAKQTSSGLTVTGCCDACRASFQVVLSGGAQPGRTIADRLKRAISLSARHAANSSTESKTPRASLLRGERRKPAHD